MNPHGNHVIQGFFSRGKTPSAPPVQRLASGNSPARPLPQNLVGLPQVGGQPLPADVRQKMELFFGTNFADVRVHVGPHASAIGALAFTQGSHIHFAPGQYNPSSPQGRQILGHELTHVVQQRAGRVRNPFGSGVAVVQDARLEAEAERMGRQAAAGMARAAHVSRAGSRAGVTQARLAVPPRLSTVVQLGSDSNLHWDGEADDLVDLINAWTPPKPKELTINNDYPPASHAVVDDDISDTNATCRSDLKIGFIAVGKRFDGAGKYFYMATYQVGPYSNVFCLWPKGWPPPAPNRFGYLPKAQFAENPGSNEPRSNYPKSTTVRYKAMDGTTQIKTFTYP